ncbi:hypothetical protein KVF89_23205 [Nocardioides carbamazepini]|uniref:hypothetical protein n=1 Tax=Nocardioides carbamazepini TaxID=2854259 RepID=UPI002149E45E|nr:hypothetical protein [Nocardioides carbamazepini]MCR1785465.1 hypothetical protein [Nocardioides carbamazepini]
MAELRRRGLLATAGLVVVAGALSGCAGLRTEFDEKRNGGGIGFGDVASAVPAAVPRVTAVTDPGRSRNGFSYAVDFTLVTDSVDPFTAAQLDDVVRAIWATIPWEVNALSLVAVTDAADPAAAVGVDLRAAAAELTPLGVTHAGQNGVTLTGLGVRYGDWTRPA